MELELALLEDAQPVAELIQDAAADYLGALVFDVAHDCHAAFDFVAEVRIVAHHEEAPAVGVHACQHLRKLLVAVELALQQNAILLVLDQQEDVLLALAARRLQVAAHGLIVHFDGLLEVGV